MKRVGLCLDGTTYSYEWIEEHMLYEINESLSSMHVLSCVDLNCILCGYGIVQFNFISEERLRFAKSFWYERYSYT
jgi:hypothetical protein